jgi:hypothetical protein
MGSSGTGKFTDYPGTPRGSAKARSAQGGAEKAEDQIDECERVLQNITLEEVARCAYFKTHNALPAVLSAVRVRSSLVGGRIAVETLSPAEVVGLLPTEYNYLLQCMEQNYKYSGQVKSTRNRPVPVIRVDLGPIK